MERLPDEVRAVRLLGRFALIFGGEDPDGDGVIDAVQAFLRRCGDRGALFRSRVFQAEHHKVRTAAEPVAAAVADDARRAERDGFERIAALAVHDDRGVSVAPAEGVAGRGDEHVSVLQIDDGRAVAVRKHVAPGGEGDLLVFELAVVKERVLKGENARGVVFHLVQRAPSQPRLPIEEVVVLLRPLRFGERLRNTLPRIGGEGARRQIDNAVRNGKERRRERNEQTQPHHDRKQDETRNFEYFAKDPHGVPPKAHL